MSWRETFGRVGYMALAQIVWLLLAGALMGGGGWVIGKALEESFYFRYGVNKLFVYGGLLIFSGWLIGFLAFMTVWLKGFTDAVTDSVEKRLLALGIADRSQDA